MKKDVVAKLAEEAGIPSEQLQFIKEHPERIKQLMEESVQQQLHKFPEKKPKNTERRRRKVKEQIKDAPKKVIEKKEQNIRTSRGEIDAQTYLREQYTNPQKETLFCQLCQKPMPFKKRDGEYYMEAVEIAGSFTKEIDNLYLALCPNCAAKYKYFIKKDDKVQQQVIDDIRQTTSDLISLSLGEENATLRFVETHLVDVKASLEDLNNEEDSNL